MKLFESLVNSYIQGVSKKHNLFDHEYLKDDFIKLVVLLVCYKVIMKNPENHTHTLKLNNSASESHRKLKLGSTELNGNTL